MSVAYCRPDDEKFVLLFVFQLATTVCYHSVLQEMLAYAGRALELLVQGLQSQEPLVPDMSLALFLQLCSRQEGALTCRIHFSKAKTHRGILDDF